MIVRDPFLAAKVASNLDFSKSLSFCLIEELKKSHAHLEFFLHSLSLITDPKLLEKLFFYASSVASSVIVDNSLVQSQTFQHLLTKMSKFLGMKHSTSTKLYLRHLVQHCDLNAELYFSEELEFTIFFSYLLVHLECTSACFPNNGHRAAYHKVLRHLLTTFKVSIEIATGDSFSRAIFCFSLCMMMMRVKREESFIEIISISTYRSCYLSLLDHSVLAQNTGTLFGPNGLSDIFEELLGEYFNCSLVDLILASFRLEGDQELSLLLIKCFKRNEYKGTLLSTSLQKNIDMGDAEPLTNQQAMAVFPFSNRPEYFYFISGNTNKTDSLFSLIISFGELNDLAFCSQHLENLETSKLMKLANQWHRLSAFCSICFRIGNIFLSAGDSKNALYFAKAGLAKITPLPLDKINFSTEYGGPLLSQREAELLLLLFKLDQLALGMMAHPKALFTNWEYVLGPNFFSIDDIPRLKELYAEFGGLSKRRSEFFEDVFRICVLCKLFPVNSEDSDLIVKSNNGHLVRLLNYIDYLFNGHALCDKLLAPFTQPCHAPSDDACVHAVALLKYYLVENTTINLSFSLEQLLSIFSTSSTFLVREASKFIFDCQLDISKLASYYVGLGVERSYSLLYRNIACHVEKAISTSFNNESNVEFSIIMIKLTPNLEVILSFYDKIPLDADNAIPSLEFRRSHEDNHSEFGDFDEFLSPHFTLKNTFDAWKLLMKENKNSALNPNTSTLDPVVGSTSTFSSGEWWLARQQLNTKIASWICDFSILTFGIFPFLLSTNSHDTAKIRRLESLLAKIDIFLSDFQLNVLAAILSNIDIGKDPSYLPYLLKDFCKYFKIEPRGTASFIEVLQTFLDDDLKMECPWMMRTNELIILVLDELIIEYPVESAPFLSVKSVVRMPSMASIVRAMTGQKKNISKPSISYLLNPDGSLKATEERLSPFLLKNIQWKGVVGREPDSTERTSLTTSDIFLYFGHGSGEKYCRRDITSVSRMIVPSCVFLMGCSSAAIRNYGLFEPKSTPIDYLLAGSNVVVGNLWDVTDKDLDRFALTALANWGLLQIPGISPLTSENTLSLARAVSKARSSCILQWAVGSAPVIWGLPINDYQFM